MKQSMLLDKYPIHSLELDKSETTCENVDAIIAFLKERVEAHPISQYIAVFDHHAHTSALPDGEIAAEIRAAKILVFCFGPNLLSPGVTAVRPRSIGVTELADKFVVNFMEAPMPVANDAMKEWAQALRNA
ncbi:DUF6858 family protein [Thiohalomonas denitrificans]|uniref:Uncharacterized protein n=1 Tax=Thiohalomonas denitrificans TaxID=415747 RepID=A0A1G5QVE1_9GAMM|nr:hypothetical protein [Thiohalomonas denitrificans]SCZ65805.1 hypothetical protein SAMN03097708_02882 [Thiohalomonas denitrificans]